MKITTVVCIVLLAATVSGCGTIDPTLKGLIRINVKDDKPSNQAGTPDTSSSEEVCTVLPIRASVLDVDALYGRAMSRFNFKSPEQLAREHQRFVEQGYRHESRLVPFITCRNLFLLERPAFHRRSGSILLFLKMARVAMLPPNIASIQKLQNR